MLRLFIVIIIVATAWYGWKHYSDIFEKRPALLWGVVELISRRGR